MSSNHSQGNKRRRKLLLVLPPAAAALSILVALLIWNWSLSANWTLPTQLAALEERYQETQRPWTSTARHMPLPTPIDVPSGPDLVVGDSSSIDAALQTPETQPDGSVPSEESNGQDNGPAGSFAAINTGSGGNGPGISFEQGSGGSQGGSGSTGSRPLHSFSSGPTGGDFGGGSGGGSGDTGPTTNNFVPINNDNSQKCDTPKDQRDPNAQKDAKDDKCDNKTTETSLVVGDDETGGGDDKIIEDDSSGEHGAGDTGGNGTNGDKTDGDGTGGDGVNGDKTDGNTGEGNTGGGNDGTCVASYGTFEGVTVANALSPNCEEQTGGPNGPTNSNELVVAIPEPGSLALFLVGLAGLAAVRRRKA